MKNRKTLILLICLIVLGALSIVGIYLKAEKDKEEQIKAEQQRIEEERLIQETKSDIAVLNENSYFYGYEILDPPPADFDSWVGGIFRSAEGDILSKMDTYYCTSYNGKYCITEIFIQTEKPHLFGIHVGDNYTDIVDLLQKQGYVEEYVKETDETLVHVYKKNHLTICLSVLPDNTIKEIAMGVSNPNEIQAIS